jgi:hypothetical protein
MSSWTSDGSTIFAPGDDLRERGNERVDVAHATFEEVGGFCAGREKLCRGLHLDVGGQDHDRGLGMALADQASRSKPFVRVRGWHADVDNAKVGVMSVDEIDQLGRRRALPDDVKASLRQDSGQALAQQDVVVGNDNASSGRHHRVDYERV